MRVPKKNIHFSRSFPSKPSILGYPHLRKHSRDQPWFPVISHRPLQGFIGAHRGGSGRGFCMWWVDSQETHVVSNLEKF
jgi:hypothetical protein